KAVASLGVMLLFTATVARRAGGNQILVESIFPQNVFNPVSDIRLPADRFWFAVTIVIVAVVVMLMYRLTRFGLATRAAAETEVGALVSGLSPETIAVVNWGLSAALAAVAGILIAPLVPLVPGTYTLFIVPALAAAVLGQFSAIIPAMLGGLVIGMLQSVAIYMQGSYSWMPKAGVSELIPLVLVLAVLLVRGKPLPTRGQLIQQQLGRAPRPHTVVLPLVVGTGIGLVFLFALSGSWRAGVITSMIMAVISLSLVVVTGYCGQISLAQMTLAGCAGFLLSTFTNDWGIPFPIAPILAACGSVIVGVVVGLPALRIRGLLVGVVTLMLAVAVEAVWFRNPDFNGGSDGLPVTGPKFLGLDLTIGLGRGYPRVQFGIMCLVVLIITALGVAWLRTSRLGSAMLAVRANERSAAASGISVFRVKVAAFAIGAFIAGIGGTLLAYKQTNVTFETYAALAGLSVFLNAYLAGITSIYGGINAGVITLGGITFLVFDRWLNLDEWYTTIASLLLIVTVIRNPEGFVGPAHVMMAARRAKKVAAKLAAEPPQAVVDVPDLVPDLTTGSEVALRLESISVRYGGVVAVNDVTFDVPSGAIVGLIGPNGAGKTTLMDAVSGFAPATGVVRLRGADLAGLQPHERARRGLGRTFQGVDLYDDLSVTENVVVGQYVGSSTEASGPHGVESLLASLGLHAYAERLVKELSQGQRQLVSIARALAGGPSVLLLDEPAAGLDTTESRWLAERLLQVRARGTTILIVDHDMGLVLSLCDLIHVLDFGSLIASGTPGQIREDRRVAAAYLGTTHDEPVLEGLS
ncbi:MAG: branched-chain amino acid ABC transporter permease/ATP-binding protein, partial [Ilumatobacteraceae bacterium]